MLGQRGFGELLRQPEKRVDLAHVWATRAEARRGVFEYIEVFYNRRRRHSSLGYLSPASYEATRRVSSKVAA